MRFQSSTGIGESELRNGESPACHIKRLEEELREKERMIQNSPICTKIIDLDRKLQFMSCGGVDALKIPDITQYYDKPYPPEGSPRYMYELYDEHFAKALAGETTSFECPIPDMKGGVESYITYLIPIYNDRDELDFILASSANITQRVEAKRDLVKAHQTLVANSKMAALGEMAGGIAHEINNPMCGIMLRASQALRLLEQGDADTNKIKTFLKDISSIGTRVKKIVNGLQFFSQTGSDETMGIENVKHMLDETMAICTEQFNMNDIDIRLPNLSSEIKVPCCSVQIGQVFLNILNNALYEVRRQNSDRWVEISFEDRKNTIVIRITDSGEGISDEVAAKIFQPFYTKKELGVGTGLGLSISKGIIERHRGTLVLDREAKNTSFVIELPKVEEMTNATTK